MFGLILGALTGLAGPIATISSNLTDLKRAKISADTDVTKAEINASISELEGRRAILIAEAGTRLGAAINASVRLLLALGPASVLLKIFLWDKTIGSLYGCSGNLLKAPIECARFRTDPLDPNLWTVVMVVIGFYFLHDTFRKKT